MSEPRLAWIVTDPDGIPLVETASLHADISMWQHCRGGESWEFWLSMNWTCKQYRLVPVEEVPNADRP